MTPTLVIMAAGLGRRFGGTKQLAAIGPDGEALFDYSIADARRAGFGQVVVIVRSEIELAVREHVSVHHPDVPVRLVLQDALEPDRDKPWGTLHAVLSAAGEIDGPFAVINADDYYGPASFTLAFAELRDIGPGLAVNIAFPLGQTVPAHGSVSRGLCQVVDGRLTSIVETEGCERRSDGTLVAGGREVPEDTLASMNFWCFDRSVLDDFDWRWQHFLGRNRDDGAAECQLPTVVGELMGQERLQVVVKTSPETWVGITNPDDVTAARAALARRT